jgi:hypothetical protein
MVESRLVLARGGNGLEDKRYLLEAGGLERSTEPSDCEVVVRSRFGAAEMDGSADDDAPSEIPELGFRRLAKLSDEYADQIFE